MDGEFRRKVVSLRTESGYEYDAQGLALDAETNKIYFVSYWLSSLLYVDLSLPGLGVPQTMLNSFWLFWVPRDVEVDDQFVYWNEYIFENVYRINKTEFDGNLEIIANGMYSPRGMVINKGDPKPRSKYLRITNFLNTSSSAFACFVRNWPGCFQDKFQRVKQPSS